MSWGHICTCICTYFFVSNSLSISLSDSPVVKYKDILSVTLFSSLSGDHFSLCCAVVDCLMALLDLTGVLTEKEASLGPCCLLKCSNFHSRCLIQKVKVLTQWLLHSHSGEKWSQIKSNTIIHNIQIFVYSNVWAIWMIWKCPSLTLLCKISYSYDKWSGSKLWWRLVTGNKSLSSISWVWIINDHADVLHQFVMEWFSSERCSLAQLVHRSLVK